MKFVGKPQCQGQFSETGTEKVGTNGVKNGDRFTYARLNSCWGRLGTGGTGVAGSVRRPNACEAAGFGFDLGREVVAAGGALFLIHSVPFGRN